MLYVLSCVFVVTLLAFAYRLRGGGFVTFGGDIPPRLLWGISLALTFRALMPLAPVTWISFSFLLALPLGFLSLLIPHAYAQGMGQGDEPFTIYPLAKWWPAIAFAPVTQDDWSTAPVWERVFMDFTAMACCAFLRATLVFFPFMFLTGGNYGAIFILMLGQPLAYVIGKWVIPTGWQTGDWQLSEMLTGVVWGLTVIAFLA